MKSTFYLTYGCYGRENFIELAKRIGNMEKRAARIIDQFPIKKKQDDLFNSIIIITSIKNKRHFFQKTG